MAARDVPYQMKNREKRDRATSAVRPPDAALVEEERILQATMKVDAKART